MPEMREIALEGRRRFWLALPCDKGTYASEISAALGRSNLYHQQPHVGVLALDLLRGRGSLIDVGANLGLLALAAAAAGSHVLAIEPLPENALYLTLAALRNRLPNLIVLPLAAGNEQRVARLSGAEAWAHVVDDADDADSVPAMLLPLDNIVELAAVRRGFLRRPLVIKIDTEGSELAVLQGAERLIARWHPDLIVECAMIEGLDHPISRKTLAVKQRLEAMGYRLYLHRGNRLAPRRASELQEGHLCDFLASRRHYQAGDRIGRFTVGPLATTESLNWAAEMAARPESRHRLHAVGVFARWLVEGPVVPGLAALARRLLDDPEPEVAAQAARLLPPSVAR